MKKILLSITAILAFGVSQGQVLLSENFNVAPPASWTILNLSSPVGTTTWFQGNPADAIPTPGPFSSQAGPSNSYMGTNFNSTTGNNTISNWIFTPTVSIVNGDVISFYTRTTTPGAEVYADRLQMRIGLESAAAPVGTTGVGGYTTLAVEVNPNLTTTGYPSTWTQYSYTVTGFATPTNCKIAFRYFVTNGGPAGDNSDYIGIDTFSVDRPLSTESFAKNNFTVYPNPATDVVNISNANNLEITNTVITDINGRIVKQVNSAVESINVGDLNTGVYFLKVTTADGVGVTKFVKK